MKNMGLCLYMIQTYIISFEERLVKIFMLRSIDPWWSIVFYIFCFDFESLNAFTAKKAHSLPLLWPALFDFKF